MEESFTDELEETHDLEESTEDHDKKSWMPRQSYRSRRILAYFIDFWIILPLPFYLWDMTPYSTAAAMGSKAPWIGCLWAYFYILMVVTVLNGHSIGMHLAQIKCVKHDGSQPGTLKLALRWAILCVLVYAGDVGNGHSEAFAPPALILLAGLLNGLILLGNPTRCQLSHDFFSDLYIVKNEGEQKIEPPDRTALPGLLAVLVVLGLSAYTTANLNAEDYEDQLEQILKNDSRISVWAYHNDSNSLHLRVDCHILPNEETDYIQLQNDIAKIVFEQYKDATILRELKISLDPTNNFLVYTQYCRDHPSSRADSPENWKDIITASK